MPFTPPYCWKVRSFHLKDSSARYLHDLGHGSPLFPACFLWADAKYEAMRRISPKWELPTPTDWPIFPPEITLWIVFLDRTICRNVRCLFQQVYIYQGPPAALQVTLLFLWNWYSEVLWFYSSLQEVLRRTSFSHEHCSRLEVYRAPCCISDIHRIVACPGSL